MAVRKALSKKTRFEVFKRDSFKCQYCGRSAPEVVLHVDHIKPVKEGGDNELFNLVTACFDCNSGKGARKLSDTGEIEKQKEELDALNERREQIEMMMQWREGLKTVHETEITALCDTFKDTTGFSFTDAGKKELSKVVKKYSFLEVFNAIENCESFDPKKGDVIKYISTICYAEREKKEKPWISELYYVRGILRNRIRDYYRHSFTALDDLEGLYKRGATIAQLKGAAAKSDRWDYFISDVEALL